jgi:hypothetical protein
MDNDGDSAPVDLLPVALNHLHSAVELLDGAGAPAHIAAHVDLARHQLQDFIAATVRDTERGSE